MNSLRISVVHTGIHCGLSSLVQRGGSILLIGSVVQPYSNVTTFFSSSGMESHFLCDHAVPVRSPLLSIDIPLRIAVVSSKLMGNSELV